MHPLRFTTLMSMHMIDQQDMVVYGSDSESLDDEESLPETTATVVPSISPIIKECLTHIEEGQARIEGQL